jgi:alkylhydroperoxidase family enzyme
VLATLLKDAAVPMATLQERYGPLLSLVETLIGVVPNCDEYMEIWPPAFRTYNLLVPNFLNLPFSVLGIGGAPADLVGLGLYVSSRVAECPYCSAHTCSFALRRGATPEKMAQALVAHGAPFDARELATIAVARALARIPCELLHAERIELERSCGPDDAEWIVAGICMMGFLNKFMDAVGVELEASTAAETSTVLGASWSAGKAGRDLDPGAKPAPPPRRDSLAVKLSLVPKLPYALRTDKRWQRGMPKAWPAVGEALRAQTGHDFPVLSRLRHQRLVQCIGSMLRENLDPTTSVLGLQVKLLAGSIFAAVIGDAALGRDVRALGPKHGVSASAFDDAERFATSGALPAVVDAKGRAALLLAKAASPSPAAIDAAIVTACREAGLPPAALVELVCWLSVLQMLHRLSGYTAAV